jgi:hypothetical protein
MHCAYCGATAPVPDALARVEAMRRAQADAARAERSRAVTDQLQSAQKTGRAIGLVTTIVVVLATLGGMWPVFKMTGCLPSFWDGKEPFVCTGNDDTRVSGVDARGLHGTAIVATGNCRLTLTDCHVRADTAIEASGNATVVLKGGSYDGVISISGNATVNNASARVTGSTRVSGNGHASGLR